MRVGRGNVGVNYVYELAKPDGLTRRLLRRIPPADLGGSGVRFDSQHAMIAGVAETSVVYIGADTGVEACCGYSETLKAHRHRWIIAESNKDLALPYGP